MADDRYELSCLVTNVYGPESLSTVHAAPERLLRAQADALGVPLETVKLESPELQDYESAMRACASRMRAEGIDAFGFGEFHSFAWISPDFRQPIEFQRHSIERVQHTIGTEPGPSEFAYWRLNLR